MAQSGFTPIKLYFSTTASAVPSAGNLADGELALNIADMKLYAKNGSGVVTLLASSASASTTGTVTNVSVNSANGLAGTVSNPTTTPAITLSTSVTGVLKGNGTAISAAVSGTDYAPATSGTSILYGNGSGGFSNVTIGTNLSFSGGTLSVTAAGAPTTTTYTNQSANVTLTSADANTLISFTLANDITVTMPDATTLSSAKNFILKNNSRAFGLIINNASGTYLFTIPPNSGMYFWTTSTATAAGVWVSQNIPLPYMPYNWTPVSAYMIGNYVRGMNSIAALSSTSAIVLSYGYYRPRISLATVSSGTITFSAPLELPTAANSSSDVSVCALTSTSGIIAFGYSSGSVGIIQPHVIGFTVSGSTVTLGTVVNLDGAYYNSGSFGHALAAMSSTDATLVYGRGDTVYAQNLTLSGTTVTAVAAPTSFAAQTASGVFLGVRALTSTVAIVTTVNASNNPSHFVITNSAGTYSKGTTVAQSTAGVNMVYSTVLSPTLFAYTYTTSNNAFAVAGTISGTSITLGSPVNVRNNSDTNNVTLAATASNTAVAFYDGSGVGIFARSFTVSGTTITMNTAFSVDVVQAAGLTSIAALQSPNIASPSASSLITKLDNQYNYAPYSEILDISGSTITSNTTATPYRSTPYNILQKNTIGALSSSQFIQLEAIAPSVAQTAAQITLIAHLFSATGSTPTLQSSIAVADAALIDETGLSICTLNATTAIAVYRAFSTGNIRAVLLTVSGSTISAQPFVAVDTATSFNYVSISRVSDTQAIVCYAKNSSPTAAYVRSLNVSGSTISVSARDTLDTGTVYGASSNNYITTAVLSSTFGLMGLQLNGPTTTVVGITIFANSATFNVMSGSSFDFYTDTAIVPLAADKALVIGRVSNASGQRYGANLTVIQVAADSYNTGPSFFYPVRGPGSNTGSFYPYAVATKSGNGVVSGVLSMAFSNTMQNAYLGFWSVEEQGISVERYEPYSGQSFDGNFIYGGQIAALQTPATNSPNASEVVISALSIVANGILPDSTTGVRKIYLTGAVN